MSAVTPRMVTVGLTGSRDPDRDMWETGEFVEETRHLIVLRLKGDDLPTSFPKFDRDGNKRWSVALTRPLPAAQGLLWELLK